jgi:tetratricopeptide (TPR) repeat protein
LLKKRKKKRLIRRPAFWVTSLLIIAAFATAWLFWRGTYSFTRSTYIPTPRFNFILIKTNHESQKLLSGETLAFHPRDRVKILKISTNIPLNLGVRLMAIGLDVSALQYEEMSLAALLPGQEIFDRHKFRIQIKYRNQELGHVIWEVQPYAEDWLDKADRTIKSEQRLALLEHALQLLPKDKRIWRRLLDEYKSLKRWKKAAMMLEAIVREKPEPDKLSELLEVYEAMPSRQGVTSVLRRLVELDPNDIPARMGLAEALDAAKKSKEAIKEYEILLQRVDKGERLPIYKRLGFLYAEKGKNRKAISYYLEAVKLDQKDVNLHYNLSYLYEKINDVKQADFYLANAVALKSKDVENRLKLARKLIKRKELKKAEQYLSEILKKKPGLLDALLLMAQIMEKRKNSPGLKKVYEKILSMEPKNETVIYNLGILEYEAGNLSASLGYLKRYVKSHPKDVTIHRILFDIYGRQKIDDMAFKEAQILIELSPKEIEPYYYMFEYLNEKGEFEKIVPVMEKGLSANPGQVEFREYLLHAYLKTGKEGPAITQIEEILKVRPNDIDLLLHLARLQEKYGKLNEAMGAYRRIIELSPGHEEAEEAYLRLRLGGVQGGGAR